MEGPINVKSCKKCDHKELKKEHSGYGGATHYWWACSKINKSIDDFETPNECPYL